MWTLPHDDRLRLLKFACSLAWADLEVKNPERAFVGRLVKRFDLPSHERELVEEWLRVPPEVDPQDVPLEHRKVFLATLRQLVSEDGAVSVDERESLDLLDQLMS